MRLLLAPILGVLSCGSSGPPTPAELPNVVLYVVDTLRADSLGTYGHPRVETPSLDRLAAEGILFERAYAPSSWTRASVASLLTGLEPDVHGVERREHRLPAHLATLSEILAAHGYTTAALVANPNVGSFFGFDQGFDHFEELYSRRHAGRVKSAELIAGSEALTGRAEAWLTEAVPRPFLLFLLTIDPHWPYAPPPRFDRYAGDYAGPVGDGRASALRPDLEAPDRERIRAFYHGEVTRNDESLGRLLDRLSALGLDDETVVVFTSDHGEEFGEHGGRFHGTTLFEEVLRVPLVIRGPGFGPGGARSGRLVGLVDLLPTLLGRLGLPIAEGLQGRDVLAAGAHDARPLHAALHLDGHRLRALVTPAWKLIRDATSGERLLFSLERDPGEREDVAGSHGARLAAMDARIGRRAAENYARSQRLRAGREAAAVDPSELPSRQRRALDALGYLDRPE